MIHTDFAKRNSSQKNVVFKFLKDGTWAVVGINKSSSSADREKLVKTFVDGRHSHVAPRKRKRDPRIFVYDNKQIFVGSK